jgi:hypothetical protein
MDEDAERGIIFTLGLVLGLAVMWLVFTTRGRRAAGEVFEAAEGVLGDVAEEAGELVHRVSGR